MENNQQQILSEIKALMASIKGQIEELENKLCEYAQCSDIHDVMDIELAPSDDLPFYDLPVPESEIHGEEEPEVVTEAADEEEPEIVEEEVVEEVEPEDVVPEEVVEEVVEDVVVEVVAEVEPEEILEPETSVNEVPVQPIPVIDAMIAKQPWRTDMPGSPVRDIRSAISLNDRILFINYLFGEDPMVFQNTLTALNAMTSFDEAASYLLSAHPEWDFESDTVYRFMMALRRRLQ